MGKQGDNKDDKNNRDNRNERDANWEAYIKSLINGCRFEPDSNPDFGFDFAAHFIPGITNHPYYGSSFGGSLEVCGRKDDQGKLRWDLLPFEAIELIVQVLTDGATTYGDDNWKRVPNAKNRYFAAMMRHIVAYKKGERFDESGRSHLAHAASNLMFLMYFTEINNEETNGKDIRKKGSK